MNINEKIKHNEENIDKRQTNNSNTKNSEKVKDQNRKKLEKNEHDSKSYNLRGVKKN